MNYFKQSLLLLGLIISGIGVSAATLPRFSSAGFYPLENSGRQVSNFNVGWRFHKGVMPQAEAIDFNDSQWPVVSLPHSVQLVPAAASGSRNYQGEAWYRKRFTVPVTTPARKASLYFEGIMGKSKFYLNGQLVKEHFGGFLPIIIDLTAAGVKPGEKALLAVCADNSDDDSFPPGRKQYTMDFSYFGGIYRDCWLIETNPIHLTNPNSTQTVAGGGVFVSYDEVSEQRANVNVATEVTNESGASCNIQIETTLISPAGKEVAKGRKSLSLSPGATGSTRQQFTVKQPALWHPDVPNLHQLQTRIYCNGKLCDGTTTRIGIRSIEFRGTEGFFLNGKPFEDKLMGVNRHQDYAYIGTALTNNLHWMDVKKLRDAGCRIIRSAHYPQDPAFMDACDELGMFIIVATPGWQYWNPDPIFEQRILSDIRQMVRRDRNHPSVLLWEPVLNETAYPESFALKAYETTHQEYPYKGCFAACDDKSKGAEKYDVIYCAPQNEAFYQRWNKSGFTREFGDCVDDWNTHNSYSRVSRAWGEEPQQRQAQHYARKEYGGSLTIDQFYKSPKAHVGGTLWHSFDHQRGYHPDPFWGGVMDAFRQPKYSYYMMMSQRDPQLNLTQADSGPMIYIANEMTPFSAEDIIVYTNCDSVRLIVFEKDTLMQAPQLEKKGIRHPPVIFKDAYSFVTVRALHRGEKAEKASIVAEGIINGKVVVRTKKMPSKRNESLSLTLEEGIVPQANGSDIVTLIASVTDKDGYVKRLSQESIVFTVEGEGELVGGRAIGANPCATEWGTAPALIRSTIRPGKVKVTAKLLHPGIQIHPTATLEFTTVAPEQPLSYLEAPTPTPKEEILTNDQVAEIDQAEVDKLKREEQERIDELKRVEQQQRVFESTEKK